MKKKAIKVATASAIAASAFAAAAPAQTDAASNVAFEVSKAVSQMKKAYHTYSDITANGEFADINVVYKEYNAAKAAYKNAKAIVAKAGGATRAAYDAQLDVTYNDYIAKRVVTYIDAYNYATTLDGMRADLEAALEAQEWDAAEELYHAISYELKTRTVILHRVYGVTARELLVDEFKLEAQDLRDSIQNEVSVKIYFEKAADLVAAGKLEEAKSAMDHVANQVAALDNDTDFGAALLTKVAEVKAAYEAKLTPAVQSVSAINGTTLQVNFNKAVNASDLIDGSGVIKPAALTVSGTASAATITATNLKGSLSADGKVLTVSVTGGSEYLDGTYAVELLKDSVKLKDDASKFVAAYKTLVEASDVAGPSITGVTYDGSTATVTFSEALKTEGTVSVNGVQQSAGTGYDTFTAGGKTLKINNLQAGNSYTLSVVGAQDVAGNYTSPNAISYTLTPPTDSVKPTVALSVSGTKVTFDFSEDLKLVDADGNASVAEFAKVTLGNGTPIYLTAAEQDADDASKFVYDFNSDVTGDFLNSSVKVESFVDKAGNAGSALTTAVTLTKDKTAPKFVSAMTKDDKLIVKYDEDVANASLAASDLSIKYVDSDGVLTPAAAPSAIGAVADSYDANGNGRIDGDEENYIVIPLTSSQFATAGKLHAGTYTVTVATDKVVDTSVAANKASSTTFTVSVAGDSASKAIVELSSAVQQATPGQIKVTFNNNMGASALVAANYKLGGTTLPSGTTLTFLVDKKNVLITLPAGYVSANGDRVFEVSNLTDIDGNTLKSGKTSVVASSVLENVAPTATKVSLVDGQNLTVDFSEVLAALPTVSGVKVKVNGSEIALDGTTPFALDGTKKVVTIKASSATAFKLTDAITVEFSNSNIKDVAGNTVANVTLSK